MAMSDNFRLPWDTVVGMGSYLVGDRYCNLDSKAVITTTQVVCGNSDTIEDALLCIYGFVKNHISFGMPPSPGCTASQILSLGFGDCVGKAILFGTMARIAKIPCRFHGYMADTRYLAGLEPVLFSPLMPKATLAVEAEVFTGNDWMSLGAVTLDSRYVSRLMTILPPSKPAFGYGIADFRTLKSFQIETSGWDGKTDTFCLRKAYLSDLGIHTSVLSLVDNHRFSFLQGFIWNAFIAPGITKSIAKIRGG